MWTCKVSTFTRRALQTASQTKVTILKSISSSKHVNFQKPRRIIPWDQKIWKKKIMFCLLILGALLVLQWPGGGGAKHSSSLKPGRAHQDKAATLPANHWFKPTFQKCWDRTMWAPPGGWSWVAADKLSKIHLHSDSRLNRRWPDAKLPTFLTNPQGSKSKIKTMMTSSTTLKSNFQKHTMPYNSEAFPKHPQHHSRNPSLSQKHLEHFLMAPLWNCDGAAGCSHHTSGSCILSAQEYPHSPEAMSQGFPWLWDFSKIHPRKSQKSQEKVSCNHRNVLLNHSKVFLIVFSQTKTTYKQFRITETHQIRDLQLKNIS